MGPQINKELLPLKAHYFLFNAGTAPVVPFMPTLARQLGFSSVVVGTMYTILPVVGMLAKPLFGLIADRFQKHKLLVLFFQIVTALAFFSIMFIPEVSKSSTVEFHCNNGVTDLRFIPQNTDVDECIEHNLEQHLSNSTIKCQLLCLAEPFMWETICKYWNIKEKCKDHNTGKTFEFSTHIRTEHIEVVDKNSLYFIINDAFMYGENATLYCPHKNTTEYFKTNCDIHCNDDYLMDMLSEAKYTNKQILDQYQFWMFFAFMIFSWIGMAVVVSVGDAICFDMLGDKHHLYGNQRLWGAVGWGIFSFLAGFLVDTFSDGMIVKNYSVVFYMTVILIGLDMFVSTRLKHIQTKLSTTILKDVGKIFLSPRIIVFFLWCIAVGLCTALVWNFLFWHLEELGSATAICEDQNWMKTLQGAAMAIQCFGGELPFFFLSGWILKKIGHINAMSLVLFGFSVRFILYSLLSNPWWVLPIELLNGLTFGIFYSTMASYASIVAPPGAEATLQGLVGAIFEGVGVSIGSFIAGVSFDVIGGSSTFRIFGICAFFACLIHAALQYFLQKHGGASGLGPNYLTPNDAITMLDDQELNPTTRAPAIYDD